VTGRASPGGPLDDLIVNQGHWLSGPGQLFMAVYLGDAGPVGSKVTVVSAPGKPTLTIVGYGGSVARLGDADAWVTPGEIAALTPPGTHPVAQMLYTFTRAGTALEIAADVRALKAALPPGAVISYDSSLGAAGQTSSEQSVNTPFVLVFALIGVVLAVLIVATLVSGAVVAGYRRIGLLKSIGFTPWQVAASYLAQIGVPAIAGLALGTVAGNLWAGPMLNVAAGLFQVGVQHVPLWIDVAVPVGMCALVAGRAGGCPAGRAAVRRPGDRCRAGPRQRSRLRRTPAGGPAGPGPPHHHRPGHAFHPSRPHGDHYGGHPLRRHRGDPRRRHPRRGRGGLAGQTARSRSSTCSPS
jgi:putative ABC transport system permease protein